MPNFEELGFKVAPSFIEYKHQFATMIKDGGFARFKTSLLIGVGKYRFNQKKKGINLEIKLLEVRHISRSKFIYLHKLQRSEIGVSEHVMSPLHTLSNKSIVKGFTRRTQKNGNRPFGLRSMHIFGPWNLRSLVPTPFGWCLRIAATIT